MIFAVTTSWRFITVVVSVPTTSWRFVTIVPRLRPRSIYSHRLISISRTWASMMWMICRILSCPCFFAKSFTLFSLLSILPFILIPLSTILSKRSISTHHMILLSNFRTTTWAFAILRPWQITLNNTNIITYRMTSIILRSLFLIPIGYHFNAWSNSIFYRISLLNYLFWPFYGWLYVPFSIVKRTLNIHFLNVWMTKINGLLG